MPGPSSLTDLLKTLPPSVRRTVYIIVTLLGAALAICQLVGVNDLGPITLDKALEIYAFISPAAGVVAVANVSKREQPGGSILTDFDEDVDLSSFEPIGSADNVYGPLL